MINWFITSAWAQAGDTGATGASPNPLLSFAPFILIFVIFYFLLIKPQQKKAQEKKEMIEALKKGAKITTNGGLMGTVTNLGPKVITIQIAEGVRVKVLRSHVDETKQDDTEK
ncbi:MAG: preprotein translocase subunit YajC [Nitrospiria bacterium]